jgi:hypothetical protein
VAKRETVAERVARVANERARRNERWCHGQCGLDVGPNGHLPPGWLVGVVDRKVVVYCPSCKE